MFSQQTNKNENMLKLTLAQGWLQYFGYICILISCHYYGIIINEVEKSIGGCFYVPCKLYP